MINKLLVWFYGSRLGGWYLELLLWWDKRNEKKTYLTPKEIAQVIREHSHTEAGVIAIKQKVNAIVKAKSKDEYKKILSEIEELIPHADYKDNSPNAQFAEMLRNMYVKKGTDVVTATDRAHMIDTKIQGVYELHAHIEKRTLLRQIRKVREAGNTQEAERLEQEFKTKYGR